MADFLRRRLAAAAAAAAVPPAAGVGVPAGAGVVTGDGAFLCFFFHGFHLSIASAFSIPREKRLRLASAYPAQLSHLKIVQRNRPGAPAGRAATTLLWCFPARRDASMPLRFAELPAVVQEESCTALLIGVTLASDQGSRREVFVRGGRHEKTRLSSMRAREFQVVVQLQDLPDRGLRPAWPSGSCS